jgi:hypothetical protein
MSELAHITLHAEIKTFGGRVFEMTRAIESEDARAARRAVAEASRAFSRIASAGEERRARHALEQTFKALGDAVRALDALARVSPAPLSVDASALAAEGAGLCDAAYDRIEQA